MDMHKPLEKYVTPRSFDCVECGRIFDLRDETEAEEYYYGHDCEA